MSELDIYIGQQDVTIDDLLAETGVAYPAGAIDSYRNRAALTALVSDDPERGVQDFTAMQQEFEEYGSSQLAEQIGNSYQEATAEQDYTALMNVLSSGELSDEEYAQVIDNYRTRRTSPFNAREAVITESLIAPSGNETWEAGEVRVDMADGVDRFKKYQMDAQTLFLEQGKFMDSSTDRAMLEMIELYLLPAMDNKLSAQRLSELRELHDDPQSWSEKLSSFLLPGTSKMEMRDMLKRVPPEDRMQMASLVAEVIRNNSGVLLSDDSHFAAYDGLRAVLDGEYTEEDEFLDNLAGAVDLIPGVGIVRRAISQGARAGADLKDSMKTRRTTSGVEPASPAITVQNTNPEKAREMHKVIVNAPDDEASHALYGTIRNDAIADDLLMKPADPTGAIAKRVTNPDKNANFEIEPDLDTLEFRGKTGNTFITEKEKMEARSRVVNDFQNAFNLNYHSNMSQIENTERGVKVRAVYGTTEGGFSSAEEARDLAKLRLREYGIKDDEIKILKRDGGEYVEVKEGEVTPDGDYLVRVDYEHDVSPFEITNWERLDSKNYLFDMLPVRLPDSVGSINRHIFTPDSTNHPVIQLAANRAVDNVGGMEAQMVTLSEKFTKDYGRLDKARQGKVYEYLKEANHKGIKFRPSALKAKGFTDDEIETIRDWKKVWDTVYVLENADAAKTLRSQGYGIIKHGENNLFAKPIPKDISKAKVYDPQTDSLVTLTRSEMDDLYEQGGTFAKLRTEMEVGDDIVDRILVRNNTDQYLRGIRESDTVLNYRHGYYTVRYKEGSHFLEVPVKDANGKVVRQRTVGVADSIENAELAAKRIAKQTGVDPSEVTIRRDLKTQEAQSPLNDAYWDLENAKGRLAQKFRGERLAESTAPNLFGQEESLIDLPEEALARSIQSISARTSMRDFLDASKNRWLDSFGKFAPKNEFGQPSYPTRSQDIKSATLADNKDVAMARNQWEYIYSLEQGYINHIDEFSKGTFNLVGDILGKYSYTGERAARNAAKINPAQGTKGAVFNAYLGMHPLRQAIIQSHQAMRSMALNPKYWHTGQLSRDAAAYSLLKVGGDMTTAAKTAGRSNQEMKEIFKFIEDSGMLDSVDKNNLVQGALFDVADKSRGWKRKTANAVSIPRRIGFDVGEKTNLALNLLTVFDRAKNQGKNIRDLRVRDELYGEARSITYSMNRAGDMPYNSNFLSVVMHFAQVPHKAISQVAPQWMGGSRTISPGDKAKLFATDMMLFGAGPGAAATIAASMRGDDDEGELSPEAFEILSQGIEGFLLNNAVRMASGETDTSINFSSSFRPYSSEMFVELGENLFGDGNFADMVAESPAGTLHGRMSDAMLTTMQYMSMSMGGGYDEFESETELVDVIKGWASIASGFNDSFKAKAMMETDQLLSRTGTVIDPSVTNAEAVAQLFGFSTADAERLRELGNLTYKTEKEFRDDVKQYVDELYRFVSMNVDDPQSFKTSLKMLSQAYRQFEGVPKARKIILQEMKKKADKNKEMHAFQRLAKMAGWRDEESMGEAIELLPDNETRKTYLRQFHNDLKRNINDG